MKSTKSFALRRPNLFMRLVSGTRSSLKLQMKKFATSWLALLDPNAVCGFANALYRHVWVGYQAMRRESVELLLPRNGKYQSREYRLPHPASRPKSRAV